MLNKKKLQIVQHYDNEFQKYLYDYKKYDQDMNAKLKWLEDITYHKENY
jgi:hypothetical protein